jgi:hypothetical protein
MDDTLKASLGELAHVKLEDLEGALPRRPLLSLRQILTASAGVVLATVAITAYRWSRASS